MRSRASPHGCPLCGGQLSAVGTRRRHFIREDGTKAVLMIRRYRCEGCGHIHHELPDFLLPYKQHTASTLEKVYSGNRWDVCCDDNDFRRLYLWLMKILLPMAAKALFFLTRYWACSAPQKDFGIPSGVAVGSRFPAGKRGPVADSLCSFFRVVFSYAYVRAGRKDGDRHEQPESRKKLEQFHRESKA